jgi:hypothetical protein
MSQLLEYNQLSIVIAELHKLAQDARARGDLHAPKDGFVPDYWYGVATGYQEAAERLEAVLQA